MRYKLIFLIFTILLLLIGTASAATMTLRPNGAGTYTNYSPTPAVANYLNVDEVTPDGNATHNYIDVDMYNDYRSVGSYTYPPADTYDFQDTAGNYGEITSIVPYSAFAFYKSADDEPSAKFMSGNNYVFNGQQLNYSIWAQTVPDVECYIKNFVTPLYYANKYATPQIGAYLYQNPFTSKKFTWGDIDNMEVGFSAGGTASGAGTNMSIWLTQLYVVVTYDPTIPSRPINLQQTTSGKILAIHGAYFNITWEEGSTNTDTYNVSVDGNWYNGTNLYANTTIPLNQVVTAYVYAYNTTNDELSEAATIDSDLVTNTAPVTSNLMTEHVIDNSQIITNRSAPYFNWTYYDPEEVQGYWQVQVGTTPGSSDMWDSTVLTGTNTSDIYAGSTLIGNVVYYVQVRTNDSYDWSTWKTGTFALGMPPAPINIANTTQVGEFWINWTFQPGSGIVTDLFNISVSGKGWTNGSSNQYHNATSLDPNTAYTINIYPYNNTFGLNTTPLTDTMTVPNNVPVLIDVSSSYELYETSNFSLDANFTDLDGGSVTFTDNSSDWDIGAATGEVVWNDIDYNDVGVHNYKITINDGFGGTDYIDFTVTVLGNQNTVFSMIDSEFDVAIAGTDFSENEIPISFSLTNSGSLNATITAKFTTSYGGVYGFVSGTETIAGTNFKLGNTTLDLLTGDGNPVTLTNGVPGEDTEILYATQIKIPSDQDALEYRGTIELTFDTS